MEASHSASQVPVAPSSPRRLPVGVAVMAALMATLTLGCFGFYPGMAVTEITYYDSQGRVSMKVRHATSWRQAQLAMPAPLPELQPLEAHSEEYALALIDFHKHAMQPEAARRETILEGGDEPAVSAVEAADPARAAMQTRMLWINHEAMSGEGGLGAAWGALIGFLVGLAPLLL